MNVHVALEETRREYKRTADQAAHGGISEEQYQEVIGWYDKYKRAMDRAAVFLTEEQREILLDVFNTLHETNSFLHRSVEYLEETDYSEFDLREYNDRFDAAEDMLKEEINGPIEAVESNQS